MNVLLIFPNTKIVTGEPPLGLAYIAAFLRENGVSVKILDTTFKRSYKFVEKVIRTESPKIVGIYASTVMLRDALRIAKIAKLEGVPLIVFGGPHTSILPESMLGNDNVDAVVVGEGELPLLKIVRIFEKRESIKDLKNIPNVYIRIGKKIVKCKERYFTKNLDVLPFPARDLLDMEKYIKHWFQMDVISKKLRGTNIITSRGCPFNCIFCQPTLRILFGNSFRRRSPENIVKELRYLREAYNIHAVQMVDDLFMINEKYLNEFAEEMIKERMDFLWSCLSRGDTLPSTKTLKKLHRAGLRLVNLGIESGVQRILDFYNKGIRLRQVKRAIKKLKKCEIKVRGFFILGAPTETLKEIKQTISFAASSDLDEAAFSILTPFPGTYLHEIAKLRGWKVTEDWDPGHYYSKGGFESGTLPEKVIRRYQRFAFLRFYLHPKRLRYLVNSIFKPRKSLTKLKCYFL